MGKVTSSLLVLSLVAAMVVPVTAQDVVPKLEDTKIEISGAVRLSGVYRDETITSILDREFQQADATGNELYELTSINSDSFVCPLVTLNFDISLVENVSARLSIQNEVIRSFTFDLPGQQPGFSYTDWPAGSFGFANTANAGSYLQTKPTRLLWREAWIKMDDFLIENLSVKAGIMRYYNSLRGPDFWGEDHEMLWSLQNGDGHDGAEAAFLNPTPEGFAHPTYAGIDIAFQDWGVANPNIEVGMFKSRQDPIGVLATYELDPAFTIDAWWFNMGETMGRHRDEDFTGFRLEYNLTDTEPRSYAQFAYAVFSNDSYTSNVHTIWGGVDYWIDDLELWAQGGYQTGHYGRIDDFDENGLTGIRDLLLAAERDDEVDISQHAGFVNLGMKYTFSEVSLKPWVELAFTYATGDDGELNSDSPANADWVSYEDNDETMILEENAFGLDVDANYWKVQFQGGVTTSLQDDDDFKAGILIAWAELDEVPDQLGIYAGAPDMDIQDKELGLEVDFKMQWQYSKNLTFTLGAAWLLGADFFDERTPRITQSLDRTGAANQWFPNGWLADEDDMFLFNLEALLRF